MENYLIAHLSYPVGVKVFYHHGNLVALLTKDALMINSDTMHQTKKLVNWFKRKMRISNKATFYIPGIDLQNKCELLVVK